MDIEKHIERIFYSSVLLTLVIKVMLAMAIPMTSDEAYFVVNSRFLDFGYYDHPPMIWWVLHLISFLGSSEVAVRLPAILSTILIGIGIYIVVKPYDKLKASLIGALFLLSPINILNVIVTTDTPLIFFSFLSCLLLYKALDSKNYVYYVLSGAFLGMAFLSKYFAALLGFSYLVYFIFTKREKHKVIGLVLLFISAVPFVAVNLYWNYTHCWANIMFNVFNRNKKETFSVIKFLIFVIMQIYLLTPPLFYYALKRRKELYEKIVSGRLAIFSFAFVVPLIIFTILSFKKMVGLHWTLAFYPFVYILVYSFLTEEELLKSIKFIVIFSLIHLLLIGSILSIPIKYFKNNKNFKSIVLGTNPGQIIAKLKPYENNYYFATPSYADSSVMSYHYKRYFMVFGGGSHHGRQDDIITDFRKLEGRNILIFKQSEPKAEEYKSFFKNVEIKEISMGEAKYYFVLGYGFNYEKYKQMILVPIKETYYNIPEYLPMSSCYFSEKYFKNN